MSLCWNSGLRGLSHLPVVPLGLSTHKCGTARSASQHPPTQVLLLQPCCESSLPRLSPLHLLVWTSVSSLTPWLLDFHIVRFSGSSGYFLFLNLLSFFWLCEDASILVGSLCLGLIPCFFMYFLYDLGQMLNVPVPQLLHQQNVIAIVCTSKLL